MKQKVELTEQILRLYVGRECTVKGNWSEWGDYINEDVIFGLRQLGHLSFPHIRPLSSITDEEANELISIHRGRPSMPGHDNLYDVNYGESTMMQDILGIPSAWLYLLSKGFDLFGLIEAGLAKEVDK